MIRYNLCVCVDEHFGMSNDKHSLYVLAVRFLESLKKERRHQENKRKKYYLPSVGAGRKIAKSG